MPILPNTSLVHNSTNALSTHTPAPKLRPISTCSKMSFSKRPARKPSRKLARILVLCNSTCPSHSRRSTPCNVLRSINEFHTSIFCPLPPTARRPARGSSRSNRPLLTTCISSASNEALLSRIPSCPLPSMRAWRRRNRPLPSMRSAGPVLPAKSTRSTAASPFSVRLIPLAAVSRNTLSVTRKTLRPSTSPLKAKPARSNCAYSTSTSEPGNTRTPYHILSLSTPGSAVKRARRVASPRTSNRPSTTSSLSDGEMPLKSRSSPAKSASAPGSTTSSASAGTSRSP